MADATIDLKVEAYLKAVLGMFAEGQAEASEALAMIAERVSDAAASLSFRLLAMRRYLRMGGHKVVAQWAWTAEETQMQASSGGAKAMYDLAKRTQQIFAQNNPGYSLAISPLRSLERQVSLWIVNTSVQQAGAKLLADLKAAITAPEYPSTPTMAATRRFQSHLRQARVQPEPTSAAPGTSDHGQGTAIDFIVMRGMQTIASTKTSQIRSRWKGDGWEARLIAAITICNQEQLNKSVRPAPRLSGPLKNPYEPWHWALEYAGPGS